MHQAVIISNRVTAMRHGIKKINFKHTSHTYYVTHTIYMLQIKIKFRLKFFNLQYPSQIVETDTVSYEFSPNFLTFSHSLYFCSHSNVPLSFPNVESRTFWSTETTVTPKSTLGKRKRSQVF